METVKVELEVPKETKEVLDALLATLDDVLAKKGAAEIATAALPRLISAVDGYEKIGDELKEGKDALAAFAVAELMKRFVK